MLRPIIATLAGKTARTASRLRGSGSALPGLVAEKVDPKFLAHALADVPGGIVVVSGTNGKTTTTKMLVAILTAHGLDVFSNPTGSNFTRGVISAMLPKLPASGRLTTDIAVLELDEAHALRFADSVPPTHSLLLNVARDQLDRFAEIDHTAALLESLASRTTSAVVLNRDDSYVSRIANDKDCPSVTYFGLDESMSDRLAELQEADARFADDEVVPDAGARDGLLRARDERTLEIHFGDGVRVGPLELRQRGLAAMINATAAATMARCLLDQRFDVEATARGLVAMTPPFGRGEVIDIDGTPLELVLVKNPAGFTVALSTYGTTPVATMVAINDNYADGRDVSWLYDVSFTSLRGCGVAVSSGVRAYDMALRLAYDEVQTAQVVPDLTQALDLFISQNPDEPKRIFCTYTAMMTLRRMLADRYGLAEFGEEAKSA